MMIDLKDFDTRTISYWLLIMAALIILLLSFLEKRKRWQGVCSGRPSLVIPFRFLDGYDNRTAYAMAFGTTTNTVVSLITSKRTLTFYWPLAAQALDVYLQAMIGCLTCFPLFACLTTRYRALGAILCIFYSLCWLYLNIVQVFQDVQENANSTLLGVQIAFNATTAVHLTYAYQIMQGLPIILCYVVLIAYSFHILWRCHTSKTYCIKGLESAVRPHQEEHVRWVLRKFQLKPGPLNQKFIINNSSQTFVDQMKASIKLRYFTNFPFFKYPTRIVALACVQLNVLYWIGVLLVMCTATIMYLIHYAEITQQYISQYDTDLVIIISVCSSFSLAVCILNSLLQIFVGFRNYRFDILRIYQGNRTFVPMLNETPQYILTKSMTFPGFQVAFMMWGIVVCFTAVLLLTLIPILLLYFFAQFSILDDIALQVFQLLSFPTTVFILFYLQAFMAKVILLQRKVKATDKDPPLNVDNRKFYELINYYSLFTNLAVGIFTCLSRIAMSAMLGTFSVGRLDRSVFTRENETVDTGYTAYTSMLLVDNAHNNPCMRVFAHLLWTKTLGARLKQCQSQEEMSESTALITEHKPSYKSTGVTTHGPKSACCPGIEESQWTFCEIKGISTARKACTRWHLAYTLINNPQLCKLRKQRLARSVCKISSPISDFQEKDS